MRHVRARAPRCGSTSGSRTWLAVRTADTHASQAALEREALTLELTRLDREISATRAAGTGEVAALVGRRHDLRARRDRAIALAVEEAQPTE